MSPKAEEANMRNEVVRRIKDVVEDLWPEAKVGNVLCFHNPSRYCEITKEIDFQIWYHPICNMFKVFNIYNMNNVSFILFSRWKYLEVSKLGCTCLQGRTCLWKMHICTCIICNSFVVIYCIEIFHSVLKYYFDNLQWHRSGCVWKVGQFTSVYVRKGTARKRIRWSSLCESSWQSICKYSGKIVKLINNHLEDGTKRN